MEKYIESLNTSKMIKTYPVPPKNIVENLTNSSVLDFYNPNCSSFERLWKYYDSKLPHCDILKITKILYREYYNNISFLNLLSGFCLYNNYKFSYDTLCTLQTLYTALLRGYNINGGSRFERLNNLCKKLGYFKFSILEKYVNNIHKIGNFAMVPFHIDKKPFNNYRGRANGPIRDLVGLSLNYLLENEEQLQKSIGLTFYEYIEFMNLDLFYSDELIEKEVKVLEFIKNPSENNDVVFNYLNILNDYIEKRNSKIITEILDNYNE